MQAKVDQADAQRITPEDMTRHGRRPIWVRSLWGDFQIHRAYYTGGTPVGGCAPSDSLLGLWNSYTPAMARALSRLAAQLPFETAADMLHEMTAARVSGRQLHRLTADAGTAARAWLAVHKPAADSDGVLYVSFDGTGVPMRKECLRGRKGRGTDGASKTREMRLACVFTQKQTDEAGDPVRDPASTTYLASLTSSRVFGRQVRAEAIRRGMKPHRRVVVITDGAKWCGAIAALRFPGRLHILDFYHAAEHVHALARALHGDGKDADTLSSAWRHELLQDRVSAVIASAQEQVTVARDGAAAKREIAYLQHNLKRMQYATFRKQGLFIGSGVVEAGCKTVIAHRAKQSGMFWGEEGVENALTLRCLLLSGRLDQFWDDTLSMRAA